MNGSAYSEVYITQLTKLIDFDILNPEGLIKMYDPDLSIKDLMENEFLKEMFMYVCMAGAFALGIIVMLLLQFVPSLKNKVKAKLIAIKDKTLWNGIIRS